MIINVDESTIKRTSHQFKGWGKNGQRISTDSVSMKPYVSMIAGVATDGHVHVNRGNFVALPGGDGRSICRVMLLKNNDVRLRCRF